MNHFAITTLTLILILLGACSSVKFPGVYHVPVHQGNLIEQEALDKLRLGMTPKQVRYMLGAPLIHDSFQADRWDYVFVVRLGNQTVEKKRLSLHFKNGLLVKAEKTGFAKSSAATGQEKTNKRATPKTQKGERKPT